jgi:hypothetical protein
MSHCTTFSFRAWKKDTAVVFLHGFSGKAKETWGDMPLYLMGDQSLQSWDIFGIGYPSSLRLDIPVWDADPDLTVLATHLATTLSLPPFSNYKALCIVAHSMGGLIAQRALLDHAALTARGSHLVLFGTPSGGLVKAGFGSWLKRQVRDMARDSAFVRGLRSEWDTRFGPERPFRLHVVAGNLDQFVPPDSSLQPFPRECWRVIEGNHLAIVKPEAPDHPGMILLRDILSGGPKALSTIDSARIAIEERQFQKAVATLGPRPEELDPEALVELALALDGLGKGNEALDVLERSPRARTSTDAMGVLAGRLKRRWLAERRQADWERSRELYSQALEHSEGAADHDQAYYHAINVAFLDLMVTPEETAVPTSVRELAGKALAHCEQASDTHWRMATEAEAALMLGNRGEARARYAMAIIRTRSTRDIDSMYAQAVLVAGRVFGEAGARDIDALFNYRD